MSQEPILLDALNERELEVISLLAEGLSNNEIANQLFLAASTVKWYVRQLNSKLDTKNRTEIVKRANELGLLESASPAETYLRPRENLPRQTTTFVGRDTELDELHSIIEKPDVRLLTILAQGGMGKTRIALEATEQQINNFPDGVYFVPLQALSDIEQIMPVIASSCFFSFQADERSQKQQVLDFLGNKKMLLLIDNWEHLLDGAPLANEILNAAPDVKILATSREKLNLMGETVYVLQGMEFPTWETPEDALRYDAVQLLLQAAQRVKPDWQVTEENLDYVARVCRLTQGMPLGILLAMSWLDMLSVKGIAEEIEKNVDFLETEMRDIPKRQQSIRAIFNYAWKKLSEKEQAVFMKMSIFRGGCTREAAEQVTGANLRILQTLINKALLQINEDGRYNIHELLRQYAEERLQHSNEAEKARDAHMDYYAQAMEEREDHLKDHRQIEALNEIERDFENVQAAWSWSIEQKNENALDAMLNSLSLFSNLRNRNKEVLKLFQATGVLEEHISTRLWGRLLARHGNSYDGFHLPEKSKVLLEAALDIARKNEDKQEQATTLLWLVRAFNYTEQSDIALKLAEESLALCEAIGDIWGQANAKWRLGYIYAVRLDLLPEAYRISKESYKLYKQFANPSGMAHTLRNMGLFELFSGDMSIAQAYFQEALSSWHKVGTTRQIVSTLASLSQIEIYHGHLDEAYKLTMEAYQIGVESGHHSAIRTALRNYCEILIIQERFQEALETTNEMASYTLNNPEGLSLMEHYCGIALCGLERYREAATWIDKALIHGFDIAQPAWLIDMLLGKSIIFAQQGQLERALELLSLVFAKPETRYWRDRHPLVLRLKSQLQAHFDEASYQAIWERGQAQVDNWRDVLQTLVDEINIGEFGGEN